MTSGVRNVGDCEGADPQADGIDLCYLKFVEFEGVGDGVHNDTIVGP